MHMMLDLETAGTQADAVVLSAGIVLFDPFGGTIEHKEYQVFPFGAQLELGRTITPSTLVWWMKQKPEAQKVLSDSVEYTELGIFPIIVDIVALANEADAVWGNGAAFDNCILRNLNERTEREFHTGSEWPWRKDACFRTVARMATAKVGSTSWYPPKVGVHHNALDDAVWQAYALIKAFNLLGIKAY